MFHIISDFYHQSLQLIDQFTKFEINFLISNDWINNQYFATGGAAIGARSKLCRSASLQEKSGGGLGMMLLDTTRVKMSHRPSLLHLLDDDQSLYQTIPELPGIDHIVDWKVAMFYLQSIECNIVHWSY